MREVGYGLLLLGLLAGCQPTPPPAPAASAPAPSEAEQLNALPPVSPHGRAPIDRSGRNQTGVASWYGPGGDGKMADGHRMDPHANVAASKTLPLGSTARVTNLATGQSATVTVEDRGPFVDGRVVDVSPQVARQLSLSHSGVAPVVVKPITVPQPSGEVKLGAGAAEATPDELARARETTQRLTGAYGSAGASGSATETASARQVRARDTKQSSGMVLGAALR